MGKVKVKAKTGSEMRSVFHPLDDIYALNGQTPPSFQAIDAEQMPQPFRRLLVHTGDMTPALESHHKKSIHLNVLKCVHENGSYMREVVLLLDGNNKPVEFGAIKITLALFDAQSQADILEGNRPLGSIMHDQKVVHASRPKAYLRIVADAMISAALQAPIGAVLYGRRNTLLTLKNESLAEIVEILAL